LLEGKDVFSDCLVNTGEAEAALRLCEAEVSDLRGLESGSGGEDRLENDAGSAIYVSSKEV
jgi:hypothetical protein